VTLPFEATSLPSSFDHFVSRFPSSNFWRHVFPPPFHPPPSCKTFPILRRFLLTAGGDVRKDTPHGDPLLSPQQKCKRVPTLLLLPPGWIAVPPSWVLPFFHHPSYLDRFRIRPSLPNITGLRPASETPGEPPALLPFFLPPLRFFSRSLDRGFLLPPEIPRTKQGRSFVLDPEVWVFIRPALKPPFE